MIKVEEVVLAAAFEIDETMNVIPAEVEVDAKVEEPAPMVGGLDVEGLATIIIEGEVDDVVPAAAVKVNERRVDVTAEFEVDAEFEKPAPIVDTLAVEGVATIIIEDDAIVDDVVPAAAVEVGEKVVVIAIGSKEPTPIVDVEKIATVIVEEEVIVDNVVPAAAVKVDEKMAVDTAELDVDVRSEEPATVVTVELIDTIIAVEEVIDDKAVPTAVVKVDERMAVGTAELERDVRAKEPAPIVDVENEIFSEEVSVRGIVVVENSTPIVDENENVVTAATVEEVVVATGVDREANVDETSGDVIIVMLYIDEVVNIMSAVVEENVSVCELSPEKLAVVDSVLSNVGVEGDITAIDVTKGVAADDVPIAIMSVERVVPICDVERVVPATAVDKETANDENSTKEIEVVEMVTPTVGVEKVVEVIVGEKRVTVDEVSVKKIAVVETDIAGTDKDEKIERISREIVVSVGVMRKEREGPSLTVLSSVFREDIVTVSVTKEEVSDVKGTVGRVGIEELSESKSIVVSPLKEADIEMMLLDGLVTSIDGLEIESDIEKLVVSDNGRKIEPVEVGTAERMPDEVNIEVGNKKEIGSGSARNVEGIKSELVETVSGLVTEVISEKVVVP